MTMNPFLNICLNDSKVRRVTYDITIIILFGLIPLLWFNEGQYLNSEDFWIPYDFEKWSNIFYLWNSQINVGTNYVLPLPAIFFNTIMAFPRILVGDIVLAQKIIFVALFTSVGLSMYYMVRTFSHSRNSSIAAVSSSIFYMFNLFQIPTFRGLNIACISLLIVFPVSCALFWKICKRDFNRYHLIFFFLINAISTGIAINPPMLLVGGSFFSLFALLVMYMEYKNKKTFKEKKSFAYFVFTLIIILVLFHSFWIFPFIGEFVFKLSQVTSEEAVKSIQDTNWLSGISANTNFYNVLRMQGNWTWYQGWNEPYFYYAKLYQTNWFFLILSWVLPILVALGLYFGKIRWKVCFVLVTIFSLFLSMGTHYPMHGIYTWLVKNIPFFWSIRSPWYKFGAIYTIGFSFFAGIGCQWLIKIIQKKINKNSKLISAITLFVIITSQLIYSFPLITGDLFPTQEQRKVLPAGRAVIPSYAFDAAKWLDSRSDFTRVIALPESTSWIYAWHFSSWVPAILQFSHIGTVFPFYNQFAFNSASNDLLKLYYNAIYLGLTDHAGKLARMLGVRYFLHETDVRQELFAGDTDDKFFIRDRLRYQKDISLEKEFGNWDIYTSKQETKHIYTTYKLNLLSGSIDAFMPSILFNDFIDSQANLSSSKQISGSFNRALKNWPINSYTESANKDLLISNFHLICDRNKSKVPVFYSFWSKDMNKMIKTKPNDLSFSMDNEAFSRLKKNNDNYLWLQDTQKDHFIIKNSSDKTITTNIQCTFKSFMSTRTVNFVLNGQNLPSHDLEADKETVILYENISINPGINILKIYSPYGFDVVDGIRVGVGILENSFKVGEISFSRDIILDKELFINFKIKSSVMNNCNANNRLVLDGKNFSKDGMLVSPGIHTLQVNQSCNESYFIELFATPRNTSDSDNPLIQITKSTPVEYHIKCTSKKPYYLVFNESFHPMWKVYIDGIKLDDAYHFVANGYANGYFIQKIGEHKILIYYWPQNLFIVGAIISFISVILLLIFLVFLKKFSHSEIYYLQNK